MIFLLVSMPTVYGYIDCQNMGFALPRVLHFLGLKTPEVWRHQLHRAICFRSAQTLGQTLLGLPWDDEHKCERSLTVYSEH